NVCMTVAGQAGYEQCFSIVVTEPQDLSVYSVVDDAGKSIRIEMGGGSMYQIQLNDVQYSNTSGSVILPLTDGNNSLTVTTDRLCQGVYQKVINVSGEAIPYPVPFQNMLNVNLGNSTINKVRIEIHDVSNGRLVFSNSYNNQSGVLQLDTAELNDGVYVLHLFTNDSEKIFKIIKK
ncbi:MAG: T9SS type A sorting domain-containing protein, partial [Bacteroidetes bacterium]|nr:T9SS type A sorting domain-containing protein [Bacteroidota bacterium]